jgi:DNA-binding transcriptional MerR regulator
MTVPGNYKIDELCTLVELPKRTVRFYIERGFVDRPDGSNRGAFYTQKHVEQLLEIKKWQQAGLSLERIKDILANKTESGSIPPPIQSHPGDVTVWSHIYIRDGVELLIEPKKSGLSPEKVKSLCLALLKEASAEK